MHNIQRWIPLQPKWNLDMWTMQGRCDPMVCFLWMVGLVNEFSKLQRMITEVCVFINATIFSVYKIQWSTFICQVLTMKWPLRGMTTFLSRDATLWWYSSRSASDSASTDFLYSTMVMSSKSYTPSLTWNQKMVAWSMVCFKQDFQRECSNINKLKCYAADTVHWP